MNTKWQHSCKCMWPVISLKNKGRKVRDCCCRFYSKGSHLLQCVLSYGRFSWKGLFFFSILGLVTRLRQPPSFGQAPVAAFGHGTCSSMTSSTWMMTILLYSKRQYVHSLACNREIAVPTTFLSADNESVTWVWNNTWLPANCCLLLNTLGK